MTKYGNSAYVLSINISQTELHHVLHTWERDGCSDRACLVCFINMVQTCDLFPLNIWWLIDYMARHVDLYTQLAVM